MKNVFLLLLTTEGDFLKNPLAANHSLVHTLSVAVPIILGIIISLFVIVAIIATIKYMALLSESMKNWAYFSTGYAGLFIVFSIISKTIYYVMLVFDYRTGILTQIVLGLVMIFVLVKFSRLKAFQDLKVKDFFIA